jgi:hypothetical protein
VQWFKIMMIMTDRFASVVVNVLTNLRALFEVSKDAYRVTHDATISAAPASVSLALQSTTVASSMSPNMSNTASPNGIPSSSSPSPSQRRHGVDHQSEGNGIISTDVSAPTTTNGLATPPRSLHISAITSATMMTPSAGSIGTMASSPTSAAAAKQQQQLLRRWSLLELTHTDADRMGDHQRHSIKHAVPLPHPHVCTCTCTCPSFSLTHSLATLSNC